MVDERGPGLHVHLHRAVLGVRVRPGVGFGREAELPRLFRARSQIGGEALAEAGEHGGEGVAAGGVLFRGLRPQQPPVVEEAGDERRDPSSCRVVAGEHDNAQAVLG